MNKKFKKIEEEAKDKCLLDEYEGACLGIAKAELGIEFFKTQEARDLQGSEHADKYIAKFEEMLKIKTVEKAFYESLIK